MKNGPLGARFFPARASGAQRVVPDVVDGVEPAFVESRGVVLPLVDPLFVLPIADPLDAIEGDVAVDAA